MASKKKVNTDEVVENVEIVADNTAETTAVFEPENFAETDKSKQPLSLEDALAAAELAAGQFESFAAEDNAENAKKATSETASEQEELPEIGAATFDPSMFDEGEIVAPESDIPASETSETVAADQQNNDEYGFVTLPDLSEERPVADAPEIVEQPTKQPTKKAPAKPRAKKSETTKPVVETVSEETPVPAEATVETTAENVVETVEPAAETSAEPDKKTAEKKKSGGKKSKEKTEKSDPETKSEDKKLTPEQLSDKLKAKLSPEKNFKLLKILIITLSVICAALSAYVYIFQIYDRTTPFSFEKIVPLIPFIAQLLLLLVTLLTAGTSKRRPIGVAFKENMQIKQEVKEKVKDEKISKEISDHLLEPEVALNTSKRTFELSSFQIDNFYKKNIEEINGKYYMQVAKFDDSVKIYNALGATDMELCAVNMVGSAKFDEILDQPRTKTLSSQELVTYFMSKPHVFAIKKRGALDWTFKYSSKSFGIIRENEDSYKVSIKCYPDAAQRINVVYKALEDSNFPSGPLWYCFNELRNLPPRVCKWLVDTSCQISQFQQIKTDKLKENVKTAKDYDVDMDDIRTRFKSGEKVLKFPKFTMIFSKGNDADLTTYLTRECEGVDASAYTKEYYYKFTDGENAVSILCPTKGLSEDVVIAIFDEIENVAK